MKNIIFRSALNILFQFDLNKFYDAKLIFWSFAAKTLPKLCQNSIKTLPIFWQSAGKKSFLGFRGFCTFFWEVCKLWEKNMTKKSKIPEPNNFLNLSYRFFFSKRFFKIFFFFFFFFFFFSILFFFKILKKWSEKKIYMIS